MKEGEITKLIEVDCSERQLKLIRQTLLHPLAPKTIFAEISMVTFVTICGALFTIAFFLYALSAVDNKSVDKKEKRTRKKRKMILGMEIQENSTERIGILIFPNSAYVLFVEQF